MTVLVGENRVAEPCMALGMAQQRQLDHRHLGQQEVG
jgi:hypothetical protein